MNVALSEFAEFKKGKNVIFTNVMVGWLSFMAIFQFVLGVDVAADNFIFNGHRYNYYSNSTMLGPIMDRSENM